MKSKKIPLAEIEVQRVGAMKVVFFNVQIFGFDVMVIVGAENKKDIFTVFRKMRIDAKTTKRWLEDENLDDLFKQSAGSLVNDDDFALIYVFKDWEDTWLHYEILVHEISHMMDSISKFKNLGHDLEGRAYLSEYLFKTLRIGLNTKV